MRPGLIISAMALAALMAMGAGCVTTVHDDGSQETKLLGLITVWTSDSEGHSFLSPAVDAVAPGWLKLAIYGIGAWKGAEALGTKRGRKNISVIADPQTPARTKLRAARAVVAGTDSPHPVVRDEPDQPRTTVKGFKNGE